MSRSKSLPTAPPEPVNTSMIQAAPAAAPMLQFSAPNPDQAGPLAIPASWGMTANEHEFVSTWDITTAEGAARREAHILDADDNGADWINRRIEIVAVSVRPIEFPDEAGELVKTARVVLEDKSGALIRLNSLFVLRNLQTRLTTHFMSGTLSAEHPLVLELQRKPTKENRSMYYLARVPSKG